MSDREQRRRLAPGLDPRFLIEDFEPVFLATWREGRIEEKVEAALAELSPCRVCPRGCAVDRLRGEERLCLTGRHAVVSSAFAHMGEENCLRGWRGSGTLFFSGCNLRCVFCQNWDISQRRAGRALDARAIAEVMLELQGQGCHNINFVTPEHVVPQVIEAIAEALKQGLRVPLVYNTSAYDGLESLRLLDGLVDIYMPDFKLWRKESCRDWLRAKDYAEVAREALREMHRQVGVLRHGPDGLACRGILLRHLVMPGRLEESAAIFRWLAQELSADTYVNIMDQYHPDHRVIRGSQRERERCRPINRRIESAELSATYRAAREAGLWRFDARVNAG